MGALCGAWLSCRKDQIDKPYREASEQGLFPIPAGDWGE
jgi:hypothetical protein